MRKALTTASLIAAAALIAACGGSDDSTDARPAPPAASFPPTNGRTLSEIFREVDQSSLVVSPAAQVFDTGENRYSFGVFTAGREQVTDANVAIYAARGLNQPALGPFPARVDSLQTTPAFRARTTAPDDAKAVYVVPRLPIRSSGPLYVAALIRRNGRLEGTQIPSIVVGRFADVPGSGDEAPRISTPTPADVGGDLSKIETRIPPDTMHETDYADVLGKEPIVLLFSTPQFCESRVCGPVADVTEQVKQELGNRATFIHMEVYRDNDPSQGVRSQLEAFGLPSEPFLFVIDAQGVIRTRIEGAFGAAELEQTVREATN